MSSMEKKSSVVSSQLAGQKRKHGDASTSVSATTSTSTTNVDDSVIMPAPTKRAPSRSSSCSSDRPDINWEALRNRIISNISSESTLPAACDAIAELRDNFELVHSTEYPTMLSVLLPVFASILKTIPCAPPSMDVASHYAAAATATERPEHRIRHAVLEICTRLPQNEILRPYAGTLLDLAMDVLQKDYDDNGLLAAKIVFELHKSFRPMLERHVRPFLDFVHISYKSLPGSVQKNFANLSMPVTSGAGVGVPPGAAQTALNKAKIPAKSTASFRVLTECPLTVMLLFQLYPKFIKTYLMQLLPLMMDALAQRPPPHVTTLLSPEPTSSPKKHGTSPSSASTPGGASIDASATSPTEQETEKDNDDTQSQFKTLLRKRARDLLSAQVKTLSFITLLLRPYGEHIKPYEDRLASNVLNLFNMCPREALTIRKDLLLGLRHIFATSFRKGFFRHVDTLLDERLLIGKHRQSEHAQLRAAAYSALADLLLHVRSRLSMAQVSRVVHLYSRVLHDASMNLPLVVQTASVRLLLNMVDPVYHNKEEKASLGRDILFRVLETLVWKLGVLVDHGIDNVKLAEERSKELTRVTKFGHEDRKLGEKAISEFMYDSQLVDGMGTVQNIRELIKPLLAGIKTLIWCINNYGTQREKTMADKDKNAKAKSLSSDTSNRQRLWYEELAIQSINGSERSLIEKYFVLTLEVLEVFKPGGDTEADSSVASMKEYRDALESFASSLSVLDSFNFHRVVGPQMKLLVEKIVADEDVILVAQTFLLNGLNVTVDFTSCLLKVLMKDAADLDIGIAESDNAQEQRIASVKMKLFSLIISSVSSYPKNEKVLRPYIQQLIEVCLRRAMGGDVRYRPGNHFTILRQLFRAIAGGKFEESYKEILPLLPTLLNGLFRVYCNTNQETLKKVIIELCLTIPARLSSLLPHLSLLLRVIVPALQTGDGDLINLGLRTLEFWVDNLNSDFLFPILSRDECLFAELMATLSTHLQPAPYQYGLLTLRLLGKLGGKNRSFLQAPMAMSEKETSVKGCPIVECKWNSLTGDNAEKDKFSLEVPLKRAMDILKKVSEIPQGKLVNIGGEVDLDHIKSLLFTENYLGTEYLSSFKAGIMNNTVAEQANAAFVMVRIATSMVFNLEKDAKAGDGIVFGMEEKSTEMAEVAENGMFANFLSSIHNSDAVLKCLLRAFLYSSIIKDLQVDASILLEGIMQHMVFAIVSHSGCVRREDDFGDLTSTNNDEYKNESEEIESERVSVIQNGKLQPLAPFGRFVFAGVLKTGVNYFIMNEVLPEVLSTGQKMLENKALEMVKSLIGFLQHAENAGSPTKDRRTMDVDGAHDQSLAIGKQCVENLLYNFCQTCISCGWESRNGLFRGVCIVLELMEQTWCKKFEVELIHVAIFCLKDCPSEASLAQKEALVFYFQLLTLLYFNRTDKNVPLAINHEFPSKVGYDDSGTPDTLLSPPRAAATPHSDAVPSLLLTELASSKSVVRFAARNGLEFLYDRQEPDSCNMQTLISAHGAIIKRNLFSKSLRNLQLLDQIAIIETFAYIIKHAPETVPLTDNHVLVFLSESLKMMSVADGEMTSESISNSVIINKDGYSPRITRNACMISKFSTLTHATGIFLYEPFDLVYSSGYRFRVKAELPVGVQLRVSSLHLFHEVLKKHSDAFLEAESSSSIGNILPHIVSLLFRSLTSLPEAAVDAAYNALKEILSLSAKSKEGETQSTHRLPKNLLQMCIKPVLLNLREYTKLSVPLLRGLSRLLSLLSTWFSKTLGEKLLEHLQKWADPEKITSQNIWKSGEEPLVAAEIINLFQLLPDESSHFVEPMIKTTLKLEAVLFRYSVYFSESPFRVPLAKYLNKHGRAVAMFFINDHRFKNPIYSELLQDIVKREESKDLRKQLSSVECSNMLLNVCFERPLAIIRSEKGGPSSRSQPANLPRTAVDTLSMHGINIDLSGKKTAMQQEMKTKQDKLLTTRRDEARTEESLRKRMNDTSATDPAQKQRLVNNAQEKLARIRALIANSQKDINTAQADFKSKFGSPSDEPKAEDENQSPRSMTLDSLELQYQGFSLVETLMSNDDTYIPQHHDIVRAFRWLWRSKGRHFRLLHEDAISPRYNGESQYLAKFLVKYSKTAPHDVDVLFDLLRIFLQPTSADFSFVQGYLRQTVCSGISLEQKRRVMLRFFPVIASEGIEELKVLSIQLLVLPMLKHDFEKMSETMLNTTEVFMEDGSKRDTNTAESTDAVMEDADEKNGESNVSLEMSHEKDKAELTAGSNGQVLNIKLTTQFVAEVLVNGSKHRTYGSRLSIELLKLCSLLLDFMGKDLGPHQKTVIKFAWTLLKSEDPKAKQWAYITISKFIVMFDSPPKMTLQVYLSLLRSHQQETHDVVKTALDILIPALSSKLSSDDYSNAMKATIKILFEEGNSVPQLSHIFGTIVRHRNTFSRYRNKFMPHLVASLNKLGLPMNSSVENRELSLTLIELALDWNNAQFDFDEYFVQPIPDEGSNTSSESSSLFKGLFSPFASPVKKLKGQDSGESLMFPSNNFEQEGPRYNLDQSEINTVVNFLVRLVLLVGVAEKSQEELELKATNLFQRVVKHWTSFEIRIDYFEKVITMCMNEGERTDEGTASHDDEKEGSDDPKIATNSPPKPIDDPALVSNILLSSCLEIFTHILRETPHNRFLENNFDKLGHIFKVCFKRSSNERDCDLRNALKDFLVLLYSTDGTTKLHGLCRSLLEDLVGSSINHEQSESTDEGNSYGTVLYVLKIVEEILPINPQILNSFASTLILVSMKLSKKLSSSSSKSRNASKSSITPASPLEALFETACIESKPSYSMKTSKYQPSPSQSKSKISEDKTDVDCLIYCLHYLGASDIPFYFSDNRKKLLTILSDVLEWSTDVRTLLIVSALIGTWICGEDNLTPLKRKETIFFMQKLASLESRGLPELDSQPLQYLVSFIVMKYQQSTSSASYYVQGQADCEKSSTTLEGIMNRISASSLMSTNSFMRRKFCKLFVSRSLGKESKSENGSEILKQSPNDALQTLLRSDLEGIGSHMWSFVFVDALIGTCDKSGTMAKSEAVQNFTIVPLDIVSNDCSVKLDEKYLDFVNFIGKEGEDSPFGLEHFLTSLQTLVSCDQSLCQDLLSTLLQTAWSRLPSDAERLEMMRDFEILLNRPYHAQFLNLPKSSHVRAKATNAVKSFLQAISSLSPLPMIHIDLLITLARNYNCWHEVRSMLEQQHIALNKAPSGPLDHYREALSSAVRRCYLELGEEDTWMSLKAEACTYPGLAYAASVDMYGKLHEALQTFDALIDQCESDHKEINSTPPSDTEMTLIEDRWISLQRETCQWGVLSDLAEGSCFSKLKMECAWKNRDWERLRNLCASPAAVSGLELGDIDVKMSEIFLAIYDGKLNEIENLHAQTAQLCLYKWQLLPSLHAGCNAHVMLLRNFNRLVDIRESGQIMVEASQYTSGKSYPDLKNLLTAWRNRLPNDYESISTWDEIFQWRSHMFTAITNKFHFAEQSTLASLHDRPWTAIRMARTARQLGVPEVSLLSLSKLTDCAMDVADAFSKLNEQILSYRNGSEDEKKGGLNLINTTNLSYFDSSQKSELFRLKADFLESIGGKTKATQAYCHAVQLCPTYARAWTSWGGLCWSLSDLVEAQSRRQQTSESAEDKAKKASNAKKVCQYLAQSMGCYLEAIHCESSAESRVHIPRCLTMLVKDGLSPGLLCSTFEKYSTRLPSWVWLPWIPQLLSSLCRTESKAAKLLLHGILTTYPQSVYFSLRSFYLERRDQERSKQASSDNPSGSTSVSCAEDLMSNLRKSQPTLWMSLESILEELIIRFRPSYEEELLATITVLLQRGDTQLEQQSRGKDADEGAVRASFSKTLSRVSEKFFRTQSENSSAAKDDRAKKTAEFTTRYKESFERDFSMLDKDKKEKLSLDDIISKLNKWKKILETRVSSTPPCLPLMQVSPSLSAFTNAAPDLWEGACDPPGSKDSSSSQKLAESEKDSSPSSSAAAALKAAINASTAVRTASTFEGSGGSQGSGWTTVEIPGQYSPNVCADERPHPELHAKLIKFEATVEVSRRNDQLVRRIGMVGSDGKVHQFLLQFAIPYWTRTDERTAQLQQLLGKCLRKESISCRRNLWLRPTAVIPIAQRLRMTAEDKDHVSLDDIYATDCIANGREYSEASNVMHDKIRNLTSLTEIEDSEFAKKTKIDAFNNVCMIVSPHILSNYIRNIYSSAEEYFQFQRTFASQTALNSLMQYAFCVSERTPCKFIFNKKTGHILSPDFRFSYSNQGFVDEKKVVPFRLTRNIEEFIGPFLMKGIVTPAMASAATAICKNESDLEQALQLLCRDDIVSWYLSKSSQREGSQRSTQDLERQLADRVKKNLYLIQSRFHECVVKSIKDDNEKQKSTCDKGVKNLLSIATSTENVVSMPLNYAAWL